MKKNPEICGFIFEWVGNIFALMLAVLFYRVIQQCCTCDETDGRKYIFMILMPALLIFLTSEYINENVYGNTVTIEKDGLMSGVNPYQTLFMQALGSVSLFCIMLSYKKLAEIFGRDKEVALLELQAHSLGQYAEEAKLRYEKTKSFRHDEGGQNYVNGSKQ